MNTEDIREIVRAQWQNIEADVPGQYHIDLHEEHFNVAINFYNQYGTVPDINYIIATVMQNNENQHIILNEHANGPAVIEINNPPMENTAAINPQNQNYNEQDTLVESEDETVDQLLGLGSSDEDDTSENNDEDPNPNSLPESNTLTVDQLLDIRNLMAQQNHGDDDDLLDLPNINAIGLDVKKVLVDVEEIPLLMIKNDNLKDGNTECVVCYDLFVLTDLVRILPCSHRIHRRCIDDHFKNESYLCPFCRNPAGKYKLINL